MAYNRYIGNTGRVVHMGDPEPGRGGERRAQPELVHREPPRGGQHSPHHGQPAPAPAAAGKLSELVGGLQGTLDGLLSKFVAELETEDLILLLILYLLYRESGDEELLIIMGALVFL